MLPPSDTSIDSQNCLGSDCQYEFIDNDFDDQEATQSTTSTDYNGAEDVTSLDGTDESEDQSLREGDEQSPELGCISEPSRTSSPIPPFTGLDGDTETPTLDRSNTSSFIEATTFPIEFEEPVASHVQHVSVKHIIYDSKIPTAFTNARKMNSELLEPDHSASSVRVIIRQTMAKQNLSSREPLRILYNGSDSAKHDIILKIASSIAASSDNNVQSSKLFNVLPISDFESDQPPEVELMHSSQYQIVVDTVASAMQYDNGDERMAVRLVLEDHPVPYMSSPQDDAYIVQPAFKLPHIGVFYCTDTDTQLQINTRMAAYTFLTHYRIPAVFISHESRMRRTPVPGVMLDSHALHMCLESRDVEGRTTSIRRVPVDLASFDSIDARQMNRHLAYLTGLYEHPPPAEAVTEKSSSLFAITRDHVCTPFRPPRSNWLSSFVLLLICTLASLPQFFSSYGSFSTTSININGNITRDDIRQVEQCLESSTPTPILLIPSSTVAAANTYTTNSISNAVVPYDVNSQIFDTADEKRSLLPLDGMFPRLKANNANHISVPSEEHLQQQRFNRGSVKPAKEKGRGNDPSLVDCEAGIDEYNEVLLKMPLSTTKSWFSFGSVILNVTREDVPVQTERTYLIPEGIVLRFSRQDAYGTLKIHIFPSKKSNSVRTCSVEFRSSWSHIAKASIAQVLDLTQQFSNVSNPLRWIGGGVQDYHQLFKKSLTWQAEKLSLLKQKIKNSQHHLHLCKVCQFVHDVQERFHEGVSKIDNQISSEVVCAAKYVDQKVRDFQAKNVLLSARVSSTIGYLRVLNSFERIRKEVLLTLGDEIASSQVHITKHVGEKIDKFKSGKILLNTRINSKIVYLWALGKVTGDDHAYYEYKNRADTASRLHDQADLTLKKGRNRRATRMDDSRRFSQ